MNLSEFPDLVVIYLGMRVRNVRGMGKLLQTGRQIKAGVAQSPDGLLLHEDIMFSLLPPTWACGNAGVTSTPLNAGLVNCRTSSGGRISCVTRPAPGSGTRRSSCAAG
jgi:hypothetical protein